VRAKNEGYNVVYRLIDLNRRLFTPLQLQSSRRPESSAGHCGFGRHRLLRREKSDKSPKRRSQAMRTNDQEAVQSAYNVYRSRNTRPHHVVPGKAVAEPSSSPVKAALPSEENQKKIYDKPLGVI